MANPLTLASRVFRPLLRAIEGAPREGPYPLWLSGGWLPAGSATNWWQLGKNVESYSPSAVVERCINLYAETVASLPGAHWRETGRGGRELVRNSALSRILREPNGYQSSSDFVVGLVRNLFLEGAAFALALRNNRFEIESLHPMDSRLSAPLVAENGDVFFRLAGNSIIDRMLDVGGGQQLIVPARDVLHVKLHTDRRYPMPLIGTTPLVSAMADLGLSDALMRQVLNQAQPSAILSTDLVLDQNQVAQLRDRWKEQSREHGTPILTSGLKATAWPSGATARDARIAELTKLSAEKICWAFGVPLQLLGLGGAPLGSTQALMQFWLATGLGFALNHFEQSFDRLFQLRGGNQEYTAFDTGELLRTNPREEIETLARAVTGAIITPNEARASAFGGLDAVPWGDAVRAQAQLVPLSAAAGIASMPVAPSAPAAASSDIGVPKMVRRRRNPHTEAPPPPVIRKVKLNGSGNGAISHR